MEYTFREYQVEDFARVRDFFVETYQRKGKLYAFTIERWNFAFSLDRIMNGVSVAEWCSRIGIWEHAGNIVAVVSSEGEGNSGFFHLSSLDLPDALLVEMVGFLEARLATAEGKVRLFIPEDWDNLEAVVASKGFTKQEWQEIDSAISLQNLPSCQIPPGFFLKTGLEVTAQEASTAHAQAFDYSDSETYGKRSHEGYEAMRKTPDYRGDLDLYIVSESDEIASFATIWFDQKNKIGILEPVGTDRNYRRLGLARAVVANALERIHKAGATKAYVGSDQPFYLRIGFTVCGRRNVWEK